MKRRLPSWFLVIGVLCFGSHVRAETETIDLKALAKKARPAVMLLVVSDATGKEIATGTGFLVSSDGKLITNYHVIEGAASAVAKAENGGLFPVEGVLADDPKNDLVLLKLKGKDLPFLPLGDSDKVEVGTRIAVIGSPLGLEGTLSEGIVSAVRESLGDMKVLQVTAAISPGSSGSPVMDTKGNVIGIAAALLRGGQSLNFALPVECATRLLADKSATPQTLRQSAVAEEGNIFANPNYRLSWTSAVVEDWVGMLKHAKSLVVRFPENAEAHFTLAHAYSGLKFTDDAIAAYRQSIKIKPDNASVWYCLGDAYGKSGRTDDAIAAFRQALKLKPDDASMWWRLGYAYEQSGHTDDAIAAYRQSVKIKPDDADTWYSLGEAYGQLGRTDDAIAAYRQSIKIKPDDADVWCSLGEAYQKSDRTDDAIAAFKQAMKLNPRDGLAMYDLSKAYAQRKDFGEARKTLIALERVDPKLASEAWYNLGNACYKSGRTDDAIAAYRQVIKLKPDDAEAWNNLGVSLRELGRRDEARDAFQRAKELKP